MWLTAWLAVRASIEDTRKSALRRAIERAAQPSEGIDFT
jgi:hypothetical protein